MVLCAICLLLKIQTQTTTQGVIDLPAWHLQVSLSIQKCSSKSNEKLDSFQNTLLPNKPLHSFIMHTPKLTSLSHLISSVHLHIVHLAKESTVNWCPPLRVTKKKMMQAGKSSYSTLQVKLFPNPTTIQSEAM